MCTKNCKNNGVSLYGIVLWCKLVAVTILISLLNGCTNLDAVHRFADSYNDTKANFPSIVSDLYRSCSDYLEYSSVSRGKYDLVEIRTAESQRCGKYNELEPRLLAANKILVDYLNALAAMANNNPPPYDAALDGLPAKLAASSSFSSDQTQAFTSLAKFVLDAGTQAYRRAKVADAIGSNNTNVKTVTAALNMIVVKDYVRLLKNEEIGLRDMYGTALLTDGSDQPLTAILVETQWRIARERIEKRQAAAQAYGQVLTEIAKGHQQLYEKRNDLTSKDAVADALRQAAEIADLSSTMTGAF
jgi:hypothetical protein